MLDRSGNLLGFLSLPLLIAGAWLMPARSRGWIAVGAAFTGASILLLVARNELGPLVADMASSASTWNGAVLATWYVATGSLADSAVAGIIIGVTTMAIGWGAGPSRAAVRLRGWVPPALLRRPAAAAGAAALAALVAISAVPVLGSRRAAVQLVLLAGAAIAGLVIARVAARERAATAADADVAAPAGP